MRWYLALLVCVVYVLALTTIYLLHVWYAQVDVVFYAALEDAAAATALVSLALFALRFFNVFSSLEKVQLILICALVGYALAISVPTVLDRSLSFYILEKLQQRGGGIRYAAFKSIFTDEYVKEHRLVDIRLTEQLESGTIVVRDGCVILTPKGDSLARFSRWFRENLLPHRRLIMGQYTDDLTDPFRFSTEAPDYLCR
jgi:hypothetical protein